MSESLLLILTGMQSILLLAFINGFMFLFKLMIWLAGLFVSFWFIAFCCSVLYLWFLGIKTVYNWIVSKLGK